ncbi:MAG: hypothetical protein H7X71_05670 [Chitinophagales bacterium]|nr:hypothetical protein [Chitinophagales bacterium]
MKIRIKQPLKLIFRCLFVGLMIGAGSILFYSFTMQKIQSDIWSQLGLHAEAAHEDILQGFNTGFYNYYSARSLKNIALGERAAAVNDIGKYVKSYVNSEAFKSQYETFRMDAMPRDIPPAKTADQIREESVGNYQDGIDNIKAAYDAATPEIKVMYDEMLVSMEQQMNEFKDPENEMVAFMAEGEKMSYVARMQLHEEDIRNWETKYPADIHELIVKRLEKFLEDTKDVDFTAALKDGYGGKKIFVNPEYERKRSEWKSAYRAGKDATTAARKFAQEWLTELHAPK